MTTILAIETDHLLISKYKEWLQDDYDLLIASSMKDALSLLSRYPETRIILMQQFVEDNDNPVSQIAKHITNPYVVAVTSARPMHNIRSALIAQGADAVLFRPFSYEQLRVLLQHFLLNSPAHPSTTRYS